MKQKQQNGVYGQYSNIRIVNKYGRTDKEQSRYDLKVFLLGALLFLPTIASACIFSYQNGAAWYQYLLYSALPVIGALIAFAVLAVVWLFFSYIITFIRKKIYILLEWYDELDSIPENMQTQLFESLVVFSAIGLFVFSVYILLYFIGIV